jgi:hypothetical protein
MKINKINCKISKKIRSKITLYKLRENYLKESSNTNTYKEDLVEKSYVMFHFLKLKDN